MQKVRIGDILVEDRARADMGEVGALAQSIQTHGLLQPVVIDSNYRLHCGGRRLAAAKLLGWDEILAVQLSELTPMQQLEVELDENIRRKNLTWQEELALTDRIVKGYQDPQNGNRDIEWIADRLNTNRAQLIADMSLNQTAKKYPDLLREPTKTEAYRKGRMLVDNDLRRLAVAASGGQPIVATPTQPATPDQPEQPSFRVIARDYWQLYHADCLELLRTLPSDSIDLVLTDPPYGVDYDTKAWDQTFDDSTAVFSFLPGVFKELHRVLKPGAHFYIFYPMIWHERFRQLVTNAGLTPQFVPLIWWKHTGPGTMRHYSMDYEPVLFGHKGPVEGRKLQEAGWCVADYSGLFPNKRHPTQKPPSLLSYYIQQSTIPGELVLDPFCGSGSTIHAARTLGRQAIGIEKEQRWFDVAAEWMLTGNSPTGV